MGQTPNICIKLRTTDNNGQICQEERTNDINGKWTIGNKTESGNGENMLIYAEGRIKHARTPSYTTKRQARKSSNAEFGIR